MRTTARAFLAMTTLSLLGAACGGEPTAPRIQASGAPALDGIGMVGSGGRSSDGGTGPASDSTLTTASGGSVPGR